MYNLKISFSFQITGIWKFGYWIIQSEKRK